MNEKEVQTEQIYLASLLQYFQKLTTSRSVLVHLRGLPVITTLFKSDPVLMKTLFSKQLFSEHLR